MRGPCRRDSARSDSASPELAGYLAAIEPAHERVFGGRMPVRLSCYVTELPPPTTYVRSVRCVVFRARSVLALRNGHAAHVLPGGRREPGETLPQTLERELLEETGWTVAQPRMIGVVRLRWLTDRPETLGADSPFYPDFLWLIHTAEAAQHRPEAMLNDPAEGVPEFLPLDDPAAADALSRSAWAPENHLYLDAARRRHM